jgi:hypothetical protein
MQKKPIKTKMKKIKKTPETKPRKVGGIWVDPASYPFFDYKEK